MKKKQAPTSELPRRLAIIADPHVGNFKANGGVTIDGLNQRGHATLEVLKQALIRATQESCEAVLIAGDLFHSRRPEPAVIAGVQRVFANEGKDIGILVIPGNHDMLDASAEGGNTACETLQHDATVFNVPTWLSLKWGSVLSVPFQSREPMSTYLAKVCAMETEVLPEQAGRRMLMTHVGVYDSDAPPWCKDAKDGVSAADLFDAMAVGKFNVAFVGNFHNGKTWKSPDGRMKIIQCGTLCPHGHSDAGAFPVVGGLWIIDGWEAWPVEIPGPRFTTNHAGEKVYSLTDSLGELQVTDTRPAATKEELEAMSATVPAEATAEEAIRAFIERQFPDRPGLVGAALAVWSRTA